MTALIVISAAVALLALILSVPIKLRVMYTDSVSVFAGIGLFSFRIYPPKKKKIKLRDYSAENYRKLMSELDGAEKKEKKPKKAETAENKSAEAENNESIIKVLYGMRHTVTRIVGEFARHIRTDTVYIKADISSDDAAKCALLCGAVSQFASYILEFLREFTKLREKKVTVDINADFSSSETAADIKFVLCVRAVFLLCAAVKLIFAYFGFAEARDAQKALRADSIKAAEGKRSISKNQKYKNISKERSGTQNESERKLC